MDITKILNEIGLVFEYFGYWSIALIVGTCLLMIPINLLYKKIMAKNELQRLRKTISATSVYLVASGLISLFTALVIKQPITIQYVFSACIPVGFLAQMLWAIIKFIKDYGIKPIISKIVESKEFQKSLEKLGVDKRIISILKDECGNIEYHTLDEFIANETNYVSKLHTQLNGLVENDKISDTIQLCINEIKSNLPKANQTNIKVGK